VKEVSFEHNRCIEGKVVFTTASMPGSNSGPMPKPRRKIFLLQGLGRRVRWKEMKGRILRRRRHFPQENLEVVDLGDADSEVCAIQ